MVVDATGAAYLQKALEESAEVEGDRDHSIVLRKT
jgi:hypothetical protein